MGQFSSRTSSTRKDQQNTATFPDLRELPPELTLNVLSNLNATDLCLAACVWSDFADDDILWKR